MVAMARRIPMATIICAQGGGGDGVKHGPRLRPDFRICPGEGVLGLE